MVASKAPAPPKPVPPKPVPRPAPKAVVAPTNTQKPR